MNKFLLFSNLVWERTKMRLFPTRKKNKVGQLGLWQAGEVLDAGDEFVAYITVNGNKNAVLVRCVTHKAAVARRALIIDTMMGASREGAQAAVQLIARTQGDQTVEIKQHQ
jgi:hypothetical protein